MLMPFIRRNVVERLLALKNGSVRLDRWYELEKTQWLPEADLRRLQWQRLQDMLSFVCANNGFYQQRFAVAGVTPDMIKTADDLRRIPILTKEEVRAAGLNLLSRGYATEGLQHARTGGSTGKSLELYYT